MKHMKVYPRGFCALFYIYIGALWPPLHVHTDFISHPLKGPDLEYEAADGIVQAFGKRLYPRIEKSIPDITERGFPHAR